MSKIKDKNIDMKYRKAANIINKAGQFPYPVTDTLIEILKHNIKEENLDFIMAFEKNLSQTLEQLKASCGLREEDILQIFPFFNLIIKATPVIITISAYAVLAILTPVMGIFGGIVYSIIKGSSKAQGIQNKGR